MLNNQTNKLEYINKLENVLFNSSRSSFTLAITRLP